MAGGPAGALRRPGGPAPRLYRLPGEAPGGSQGRPAWLAARGPPRFAAAGPRSGRGVVVELDHLGRRQRAVVDAEVVDRALEVAGEVLRPDADRGGAVPGPDVV